MTAVAWGVLFGCTYGFIACGGRRDTEGRGTGTVTTERPDSGSHEDRRDAVDSGENAAPIRVPDAGSGTSSGSTGGEENSPAGGQPSGAAGHSNAAGGTPNAGGAPLGGTGGQGGDSGGAGGTTHTGGVAGAPVVPAGCEVSFARHDDEACGIQVECPDYQALRSTYAQVTCKDLGKGETLCTCSSTAGYWQLPMPGTVAAQACTQANDVCLILNPAPDLSQCRLGSQSRSQDACSYTEDCPHSGVQDGVTFMGAHARGADCFRNGGEWDCDCHSPEWEGTRSVSLDGKLSSKGLCPDALRLCQDGTPPAAAPESCELVEASVSTTECYAEQACTREATMPSGPTVTSRRNQSFSCSLHDDTPPVWYCSCGVGGVSVSVSTDVSKLCEDPVSACGW